jgi:septal ring factor EnvC (AmiA/AmiB activator)
VSWHYLLVLVIDMLVDVKDSKFARDTSSMALINNDYSAREEYYSKVKMMTMQKNEINSMKSELNSLKTDIQDIKNLLTQLIGKGGNG